MNLNEIITAKTASETPWEISRIEFHQNKPILIVGVVFSSTGKLEATWIVQNGVCFVDDEPRREFNLIKQ